MATKNISQYADPTLPLSSDTLIAGGQINTATGIGTDVKIKLRDLIAGLLSPKGVFSSSTTYVNGNVVTYNGSAYLCVTTMSNGITGVVPGSDANSWTVFVAKGDAGVLTPEYQTILNNAIAVWEGAVDEVQAGANTATAQAAVATNAATVANTASTSLQQALAAFRQVYLGSFAADPAVDGNGNPLVIGAEYFNTTENKLRVWDGTQWQDYDESVQTLTQNATLAAANAAGSATTAANAAAEASNYLTAVQQAGVESESNAAAASQSATNASNSASSASGSADQASASASSASTSATNAASSATSAQNSLNAIGDSVSQAAASASSASSSANGASQSATNAGNSATSASNSASSASTSATNAASSASSASTSATNAANSATAAEQATAGKADLTGANFTGPVSVVGSYSMLATYNQGADYGVKFTANGGATSNGSSSLNIEASYINLRSTTEVTGGLIASNLAELRGGATITGNTSVDGNFSATNVNAGTITANGNLTTNGDFTPFNGISFVDGTKQTTASQIAAVTLKRYTVASGFVAAGNNTITDTGFLTIASIDFYRSGTKLDINIDYTLNTTTGVATFSDAFTANTVISAYKTTAQAAVSNVLALTGGNVTGATSFGATVTFNGPAVYAGAVSYAVNPTVSGNAIWHAGNLLAPIDTGSTATKLAGRTAIGLGLVEIAKFYVAQGSETNTFNMPSVFSTEFESYEIIANLTTNGSSATASSSVTLGLRYTEDNGSTWLSGSAAYTAQNDYVFVGGTSFVSNGGNASYGYVAPVSAGTWASGAKYETNVKLEIDVSTTGLVFAKAEVIGVGINSSSPASLVQRSYSMYQGTTAVKTGLQLFVAATSGSSTLVAGTVRVYGRRKSL